MSDQTLNDVPDVAQTLGLEADGPHRRHWGRWLLWLLVLILAVAGTWIWRGVRLLPDAPGGAT